jgi:putative peptide zinc metalloprotease protein
LEIRKVELLGEEKRATVQLTSLERLMHNDRQEASAQLSSQHELLMSLQKSRAKAEDDVNRLVIVSPRDGIVFPPPRKEPQPGDEGRLPSWTGSPLENENRGAMLADSDVLCYVGNDQALEAVLVIDQGDVQLVEEGMEVDLKFDAARMRTFHGVMGEVSLTNLSAASMSMASQAGGDLQTEIDPATGQPRPRSISYQCRVPLEPGDFTARIGYRGSAKIHTKPRSLGWRLWRVIVQTFNFEL